MKETIEIQNFGPIKDISLDDIRPLTIFIGESGSGKSTIMKTLVLFRWIFKMISIRAYLKKSGMSKSPFRFSFDSYLKNNGLDKYVKADTYIKYTIGSYSIIYKDKKLQNLKTLPESHISLEKNCFVSDKRNMIADILAHNTAKSSVGYFLRETLEDYRLASQTVRELDFDYLNVKLEVTKTSKGDKHLIVGTGDDDYKINLEDASSGTQTVTPLSVITEYYSRNFDLVKSFNNAILGYLSNNDNLTDFRAVKNVGEIDYKRVNIHIEEPELSLYPESQRSLMNYIVNRCFVEKPEGYDLTVMLATHSPYIINHINLLVMANRMGTLEEGANIAFEDVNIYEISDGYLTDLKQDETFVFDTRTLSDPISNIYQRFEQLKDVKQ